MLGECIPRGRRGEAFLRLGLAEQISVLLDEGGEVVSGLTQMTVFFFLNQITGAVCAQLLGAQPYPPLSWTDEGELEGKPVIQDVLHKWMQRRASLRLPNDDLQSLLDHLSRQDITLPISKRKTSVNLSPPTKTTAPTEHTRLTTSTHQPSASPFSQDNEVPIVPLQYVSPP